VHSPDDVPNILLEQIAHFFAHYKDLEPGKFVKIDGWKGIEAAKNEIMEGVSRYAAAADKPAF
jgi:inorganic pyrophosphatase